MPTLDPGLRWRPGWLSIAAAGWWSGFIACALTCLCAASEPQAGGETPAGAPPAFGLHAAAGAGNLELVLAILAAHPDAINAPDAIGCTPLHWAADANHAEVVTALLAAHAAVDAANNIGQTPLYWSACDGHAGIVRLLLVHHADPRFMARDGSCPRSVASKGLDGLRNPEVLELLGCTAEATAR